MEIATYTITATINLDPGLSWADLGALVDRLKTALEVRLTYVNLLEGNSGIRVTAVEEVK